MQRMHWLVFAVLLLIQSCWAPRAPALSCFDCEYNEASSTSNPKKNCLEPDPSMKSIVKDFASAKDPEGLTYYCHLELKTICGLKHITRTYTKINEATWDNVSYSEGPIKDTKDPEKYFVRKLSCKKNFCNDIQYTPPPLDKHYLKCFVCGVKPRTGDCAENPSQKWVENIREFPGDDCNPHNLTASDLKVPAEAAPLSWKPYCTVSMSLNGKQDVKRGNDWTQTHIKDRKCTKSGKRKICVCKKNKCNDFNMSREMPGWDDDSAAKLSFCTLVPLTLVVIVTGI